MAADGSLIRMTVRRAGVRAVLAAGCFAAGGQSALAGHEVTFYPSYYPHEIRIETVDPEAAAARLAANSLHVYLGALPAGGAGLPEHVAAVESLESFVVLDVNPASPVAAAEGRCAVARAVVAALGDGASDVVIHPHPVTPYHPDQLHHLDRIDAARAALAGAGPVPAGLKVDAQGPRLAALVGGRWQAFEQDWDVRLREVGVRDLIGHASPPTNGWLGAPWAKEGWFQAYRLLAPAVVDAADKAAADALYRRLARGDYLDLAERVNLERRLIDVLGRGCHRAIVGYTLRREHYTRDYTFGVENVGHDSQTGLDSPIFVRTVKLKDYPWNGELTLGVERAPEAAWNPVAGFTDAAGRLVWSTVGDPALVPLPYNASWVPNRLEFTIERTPDQSGGFRLPAEAVRPEPGTGALALVSDPSFAPFKLVYDVFASPFLDGTRTEVADLVYAFVTAYRWGVAASTDDPAYDTYVDAATAYLRDRLVGYRVVRVRMEDREIAPGIGVFVTTPIVEVYLKDAPGDDYQVAAVAPPWSTVPWHLLALMEAAVLRGDAAFSEAEAERRGVPWLDLVRDREMVARLEALIADFERAGYRPDVLADLVTAEEAAERWRALGAFADETGHLLVTNGPYRLTDWQPGVAVFAVMREPSYPLGFGTFDRYVHPLRAVIRDVARDAGEVSIRVDVEQTLKIARHYETEVAPLSRTTARGTIGTLIVSRYLLIGPDGSVARAGKLTWHGDDRLSVALPDDMAPGQYTIAIAVFLDGNSLMPSLGLLRFEAGG